MIDHIVNIDHNFDNNYLNIIKNMFRLFNYSICIFHLHYNLYMINSIYFCINNMLNGRLDNYINHYNNLYYNQLKMYFLQRYSKQMNYSKDNLCMKCSKNFYKYSTQNDILIKYLYINNLQLYNQPRNSTNFLLIKP